MADRLIRFKTISRIERALKSAEVAEKGHVACIDLTDGSLVAAADADANLFPIGWFESALTGDGTKTVPVKLFSEHHCALIPNADTGPVTDADIASLVYLSGSAEVSVTATSRSVAGRAWGLQGSLVLVEMASDLGPTGPQGEPGV